MMTSRFVTCRSLIQLKCNVATNISDWFARASNMADPSSGPISSTNDCLWRLCTPLTLGFLFQTARFSCRWYGSDLNWSSYSSVRLAEDAECPPKKEILKHFETKGKNRTNGMRMRKQLFWMKQQRDGCFATWWLDGGT